MALPSTNLSLSNIALLFNRDWTDPSNGEVLFSRFYQDSGFGYSAGQPGIPAVADGAFDMASFANKAPTYYEQNIYGATPCNVCLRYDSSIINLTNGAFIPTLAGVNNDRVPQRTATGTNATGNGSSPVLSIVGNLKQMNMTAANANYLQLPTISTSWVRSNISSGCSFVCLARVPAHRNDSEFQTIFALEGSTNPNVSDVSTNHILCIRRAALTCNLYFSAEQWYFPENNYAIEVTNTITDAGWHVFCMTYEQQFNRQQIFSYVDAPGSMLTVQRYGTTHFGSAPYTFNYNYLNYLIHYSLANPNFVRPTDSQFREFIMYKKPLGYNDFLQISKNLVYKWNLVNDTTWRATNTSNAWFRRSFPWSSDFSNLVDAGQVPMDHVFYDAQLSGHEVATTYQINTRSFLSPSPFQFTAYEWTANLIAPATATFSFQLSNTDSADFSIYNNGAWTNLTNNYRFSGTTAVSTAGNVSLLQSSNYPLRLRFLQSLSAATSVLNVFWRQGANPFADFANTNIFNVRPHVSPKEDLSDFFFPPNTRLSGPEDGNTTNLVFLDYPKLQASGYAGTIGIRNYSNNYIGWGTNGDLATLENTDMSQFTVSFGSYTDRDGPTRVLLNSGGALYYDQTATQRKNAIRLATTAISTSNIFNFLIERDGAYGYNLFCDYGKGFYIVGDNTNKCLVPGRRPPRGTPTFAINNFGNNNNIHSSYVIYDPNDRVPVTDGMLAHFDSMMFAVNQAWSNAARHNHLTPIGARGTGVTGVSNITFRVPEADGGYYQLGGGQTSGFTPFTYSNAVAIDRTYMVVLRRRHQPFPAPTSNVYRIIGEYDNSTNNAWEFGVWYGTHAQSNNLAFSTAVAGPAAGITTGVSGLPWIISPIKLNVDVGTVLMVTMSDNGYTTLYMNSMAPVWSNATNVVRSKTGNTSFSIGNVNTPSANHGGLAMDLQAVLMYNRILDFGEMSNMYKYLATKANAW